MVKKKKPAGRAKKPTGQARRDYTRVMLYLKDNEIEDFKAVIPPRMMVSFVRACMGQYTKFAADQDEADEHARLETYVEFIKQLKEIRPQE